MKNALLIVSVCAMFIAALFVPGCKKNNSPAAPEPSAPTRTATSTVTSTDTPENTATATNTVTATGTNTSTPTDTVTLTTTPSVTMTGTITDSPTHTQTATPTATVTITPTPLGTPRIGASLRYIKGDASYISIYVSQNGTPVPDATVVVVKTDVPVETYTINYLGYSGSYWGSEYALTTYTNLVPEANYTVNVTIGDMTFSGTNQMPSMPAMQDDGLSVVLGSITPRLDVTIYDPLSAQVFNSSTNMNPASPFPVNPAIYTLSGYYNTWCYVIQLGSAGPGIFPGTDPAGTLNTECDERRYILK